MKQKNKNKFIMDTDWLFDGILDAEQKQYVLLTQPQNEQHNINCASETYRIHLVERAN